MGAGDNGNCPGKRTMMNLAVWRIDDEGSSGGQSPLLSAVERSHLGVSEKQLESWIAADAKLIGGGLTIVGRQVYIDDGVLDLLAIDGRDRWVVLELKAGRLDAGALHQALYYASSLARLSADDLRAKLEPKLEKYGDAEMLSARLRQLLDSEADGGSREIAVALVGVGISAGLERMQEFLGRSNLSIDVVSFEVFELAGGPRLLIRELLEEQADAPSRPRAERTVDAIRRRAADEKVLEPFERFIEMSKDAGLFVRPYTLSVMITPPAHRGRFLMYATPRAGGIHIAAGPDAFAEFFDDVSEQEAAAALDPGNVDQFLTGEALDARIEQIRKFLIEKLPPPGDHVSR